MSEHGTTKDVVIEALHSRVGDHGNRIADDGYVYRCRACGKRSRDRYGVMPIDSGFDESCMLNSALEKAE